MTNCKNNCSKIHSYEKKIGEKRHVVIFLSSHVGSLYLICTHYHQITNLHVSWVCSKSMQNLLFHSLYCLNMNVVKHESHVHDLCVLNNV
jgi:DNA mismatch repair ATPase MutS